jgi:outer membrane autotransporter protein
MPARNGWTVVPRLGFQYIHLDQSGYTETGSSGFDLTSPSSSTDSFQPVASVAAFKPFRTQGGMRIVPEFKISYARELLSVSQTLSLTTPSNSLVPASGITPARNTIILGPSVTASMNGSLDLYADYKLSLGLGKSVDNIIFAGARWTF